MHKGDCAFIRLDPVMDMRKAMLLEDKLEKFAIHGKKKIYLDFSDVEFLCSYMMRVFIKFHKTWTRGGIKLGFQYLNDYSKDSLRMSGLDELFTLSTDWEAECELNED